MHTQPANVQAAGDAEAARSAGTDRVARLDKVAPMGLRTDRNQHAVHRAAHRADRHALPGAGLQRRVPGHRPAPWRGCRCARRAARTCSRATCSTRSRPAQIAAATLDAFRTEPLPPGHPFWHGARITVTPPIATRTALAVIAWQTLENLAQIDSSLRPPRAVDKGFGY